MDVVFDGEGATLMPGLVEAHAHLTWPSSVERVVNAMKLPPEEHLLVTAQNARILLDHGFTSAYSAARLGSGSNRRCATASTPATSPARASGPPPWKRAPRG